MNLLSRKFSGLAVLSFLTIPFQSIVQLLNRKGLLVAGLLIPLAGFWTNGYSQTCPGNGIDISITISSQATHNGADVSCFGACDGEVTIAGSQIPGPSGPFSYSFDGSAYTSTTVYGGLCSGVYQVIVRDSGQIISPGVYEECTTTVTLNDPTPVSAAVAVVTDADCNGAATGAIDLTPSGGTVAGSYTFDWDNDGTGDNDDTEDLASLTAGNYQIEVIDDNGCSDIQTHTVGEPTAIIIVLGSVTDADCNGASTGAIDITPSGGTVSLDYIYDWDNDGTGDNDDTQDLASITAGNYQIQVYDDNGCSAIQSYTVNEPTAINITLTTLNHISCNGLTDGSIDITPSGGTVALDYVYDWDNDGTGDNDDTQDLSGLANGNYQIEVIDDNGCSSIQSYTINEPTAVAINLTLLTNVDCFGNSTGAIDITPSGGTVAVDYIYDWDNDGTGDNDDTQDLSSLPAGSYQIEVIDDNGCSDMQTYNITEPAAPVTVTASGTDVSCFGELDGTVTCTPAGGTVAVDYSYSWDNGAGTNQSAVGLGANTYTVTVTDDNGCTAMDSYTVTQPAMIDYNLSFQNVTCGALDGEIDIDDNVAGLPYEHSIDNGSNWTPNCCANVVEYTALSAGTYDVWVRDPGNGCIDSTTITLTTSGGITIGYVEVNDVSCFGYGDGSIVVTAGADGIPPITYSIDNGSNFQASDTFPNLSGATYDVVIQDVNGCQGTQTVILNEAPAVGVFMDSIDNVSCAGLTDGTIYVTGSGGVAPLLYSVDSVNWQTNGALTGLDTGAYVVYMMDNNGCVVVSNSDTVRQDSYYPIPFTLNLNSTYSDQNPDIDLTLGAAPQTSSVNSYSIFGDGVWSDSLHIGVLPLSPPDYYVTYTIVDTAGCTYIQEDTFQVLDIPLVSSDPTPITINNIDYNTYAQAPSTIPIFCEGDNGVYTLRTNSAHGGYFQPESYVTPNPYPYTPAPCVFCGSYQWTHHGEGTASLNVNNLTPGTYFITYAEFYPSHSSFTVPYICGWSGGWIPVPIWCYDTYYTTFWNVTVYTTSFKVIKTDAGNIMNILSSYCVDNPPVNFNLSPTVTPAGSGVASVEWYSTNGGFSNVPETVYNPSFDPSTVAGSSTDIEVHAIDVTGTCGDTAYATVTINPLPVLAINADTIVCPYDPVTFNGTANGNPVGNFVPAVILDNQAPDDGAAYFDPTLLTDDATYTYTYGYTDANGCTDSMTQDVYIIQRRDPVFNIDHTITNPYSSYVPPTSNFNWPNNGTVEVCNNDTVMLSGFIQQGMSSVMAGDLSWNGSGTTGGQISNVVSNPNVTAETDSVFYHYTETLGPATCDYYDTLFITINPTPPATVYWFGDADLCATPADSLFVILNPTNNYFSVNGDESQLFYTSFSTSMTQYADTANGLINTVLNPADPFIDPANDTVQITFHHIDPVTTCWVDVFDTLYIHPLPTAGYQKDSSCVNSLVTFIPNPDDSTWTYYWDLDDGGIHIDDTVMTSFNDTVDQYIFMEATTQYGCVDTIFDTLTFGLKPSVDFRWGLGCITADSTSNPLVPLDSINFEIYGNQGSPFAYDWDFGDLNTANDSNLTIPHLYGNYGTYNVTLTATSGLNCAQTLSHLVHVQPIVTDYPYFDDLNTVPYDEAWHIDVENSVNTSWQLGVPQGFFSGTSNAYVTDTIGNYNDDEFSYVEGPCFDLSSLQRPMIKLQTWSQIGDDFGIRDGATLEYLSPSDTIWRALGDTIEGLNWYNTGQIAPGSEVGWTGFENDWKDSRYKLDTIQDDAYVKLRIAFRADDAVTGGGFAFDDVWIGERYKRVLIEQMTNIFDDSADTYIDDFDSTMAAHALDAIDIQYHVEVPAGDPMWFDYSAGPNARTLYYSTGNTVPYTISDGNVWEGLTRDWLVNNEIFRSTPLRDPGFIVDLTGTSINTGTREVDVHVKLEALNDYVNEDIRVHIAVVENGVFFDNYNSRNVIRQMLPNAGGAALPVTSMMKWDTLSMASQQYTVPLAYDINNVSVVAFVQNYDTREVYQAAIDTNFLLATDIADVVDLGPQYSLYPNPATDFTSVVFPAPAENLMWVDLYDNLGKLVESIQVQPGETVVELQTATLQRGVYMVNVRDNKSKHTTKKLVLH